MGKTRSCRRTEDENKIHEKAVKMRKMTDEQLVHYVEDRVRKAESEGYNRALKESNPVEVETVEESVDDGYAVAHFIEEIANLPGIGHATMNKIKIFARDGGYVGE
jgi:hypothetical protein